MRSFVTKFFRAPIALFSLFVGLLFIGAGFEMGEATVRLGIIKGLETENWAKADRAHLAAGTGGVQWPGRRYAGCELMNFAYDYEVDGKRYSGVNYHSMGRLIADEARVYRARSELHSIDAWYDPENPTDSVVKKGISYDCSTFIALRRLGYGVFISGLAFTYIMLKSHLVRGAVALKEFYLN